MKLDDIMKSKWWLRKLTLDEVSGVDIPANPLATVALFKSLNENQGEIPMTLEELRKKLAEMESNTTTLQKQLDDSTKVAADATTALEAMTKALEEAGVKIEKADDGEVSVAKAAEPKDEDFVLIGGEKVAKASVPAPILKQLQDQAAELATIRKASEAADFQKRAVATMPNLGGTEVEKGLLLKAVESIADEAARTNVLKALRAADAAVSKMFEEVGGADNQMSSEDEELDKLVKAHAESKSVSKEVAFAEVTKSGRGKELLLTTRK